MINPEDATGMLPIEEAAPGIKILPLPPGYTVLEAVVAMKCLDEDGHIAWVQRWTAGLHIIEVTGASGVLHALNKRDAVAMYEPDDDD